MKSFSITDVGKKRKMNQDYVFTADYSIGNLPNLFIVADGMGGHNAGDFASKYTAETLLEAVRSSQEKTPVKIMEEAIQKANRSLIEKAEEDQNLAGMGTTLVAATIAEGCLYIANVGDSRLYVVGKEIRQITRDHSLVEEMVRMGEIRREDARSHPDKNIITRAIGAGSDVTADFFEVDLENGDMILMCTDGLTNMMEDEMIMEIMKKPADLGAKAEELVETANRNGGKDNIAVLIIEPFSGEVNRC
ncbi:Stp1/IreP family PP2C-type Ser/Thr phosphatase [Anaerobium acetethylicum]|uniref:Protein phosphatase n=1 Tax=Anaerobium acetethylicum TaxID=1619234 RepID=A0A1D3TV98_9FIRM|nr:Stp1/IreP family PP2C-type Ser/Thr phosphatase [Anaerobium acetethylicum]SCP98055.1 protein phosphatase [Anaerobium acetethylicum]